MKVFGYETDNNERHCRERMAVEIGEGDLRDTYWGIYGSDRHKLTATEMATAELLFDTDDYDELERYSRDEPRDWLERAEKDRQRATEQHGLRVHYFILKGSLPDLATKISNAENAVEAAASTLRQAEDSLRWKLRELAEISGTEVEQIKVDQLYEILEGVREFEKTHVGQWIKGAEPTTFDRGVGAAAHDILDIIEPILEDLDGRVVAREGHRDYCKNKGGHTGGCVSF